MVSREEDRKLEQQTVQVKGTWMLSGMLCVSVCSCIPHTVDKRVDMEVNQALWSSVFKSATSFIIPEHIVYGARGHSLWSHLHRLSTKATTSMNHSPVVATTVEPRNVDIIGSVLIREVS